MYYPSNRLAGDPVTNIQSTFRTAPGLCKNVSLPSLFSSNDYSHTVPTVLGIYMCIYIHIAQYRDAIRAKEKNIGTKVNSACQENLSVCHLGHACHGFASPSLDWGLISVTNSGAREGCVFKALFCYLTGDNEKTREVSVRVVRFQPKNFRLRSKIIPLNWAFRFNYCLF
jgi:hypothetical protein